MHFQWYPGHMSKARRQMQEDIKLIDVVIELVDARIPYSSKNPDIDYLAKDKARIILMNKNDLADPRATDKWKAYYEKKGWFVALVNSKSGNGVKSVTDVIMEACKEKTERDRERGILNRPIRAMIVGIPNVGKSTFINSFAGKACVKTGNKPGVTKGKQWIRLNKDVELLDTPGILWPKFEDQRIGMRIAFIGSINGEILVPTDLAYELCKYMIKEYPGALAKKYEIEEDQDVVVTLERIAKVRGCLLRGGEYDLNKAAIFILDDYRNGRIERITLESPEMIAREIKERKEEEKIHPVKKTAREKSAESLAKREKRQKEAGTQDKKEFSVKAERYLDGRNSDHGARSNSNQGQKSAAKSGSSYGTGSKFTNPTGKSGNGKPSNSQFGKKSAQKPGKSTKPAIRSLAAKKKAKKG